MIDGQQLQKNTQTRTYFSDVIVQLDVDLVYAMHFALILFLNIFSIFLQNKAYFCLSLRKQ